MENILSGLVGAIILFIITKIYEYIKELKSTSIFTDKQWEELDGRIQHKLNNYTVYLQVRYDLNPSGKHPFGDKPFGD